LTFTSMICSLQACRQVALSKTKKATELLLLVILN
jgi:hypothetical protein